MADQHWQGNGGADGHEHKDGMTRAGSLGTYVERYEVATRGGASPMADGGGGSVLRAFADAFTIGRSRRCDLVIPTSDDTRTISKVHARIFPMRTSDARRSENEAHVKWMLQDLDTMNGTAINGMDLMPGGSMELHDGDEIVLSSSLRLGTRVSVHIPDVDRTTVLVKVDGLNSGTPAAVTFGASPTWRGMQPHVGTPRSNQSPMLPSSHKRHRPSSETVQSGNGQDVSGHFTHDSKRTRRDDNDDKERFMACPVCLDYFYNSATLACSHTFCGHCISHWFRTSASLSCPECRAAVKHMPVRNRALDDLVQKLVGETDAFQSAARKRSTHERPSSRANEVIDLRTHPLVFTRWSSNESILFSEFITRQFGETRVGSCRQVGLTEAAIDGASASELLVAAKNLLIDCSSLRAFHETSDRLKIYLHYG